MPTWEQNKDWRLRKEARGDATDANLRWLERWRNKGSPDAQAGMLSQKAPAQEESLSLGGYQRTPTAAEAPQPAAPTMWEQITDVNQRYNDSLMDNYGTREYMLSQEDFQKKYQPKAPLPSFGKGAASREIEAILREAGITTGEQLMQENPGSDTNTFANLGVGNRLYGSGQVLNPQGGSRADPTGGSGHFSRYSDYNQGNTDWRGADSIGQYSLTERGKKDSLFGNPIFSVLAAAAAPFTGGLSLVAQQAARAADGDTLHGGDYAGAAAGVAGGMLAGGGLGLNQGATAGQAFGAGAREAYAQRDNFGNSNDTPIADDINPDTSGPMIGNTPVNSREGWHWEKDPTGISGWKAVKDILDDTDEGGGGSSGGGGGSTAPSGGTSAPSSPPTGEQRDPNTTAKGTEVEQWRHTNPDGTTVAGDETGDVWEVEPEPTDITEGDSDLEGVVEGIIGQLGDDPQAIYDGLTLGGYVDPTAGEGTEGTATEGTGTEGDAGSGADGEYESPLSLGGYDQVGEGEGTGEGVGDGTGDGEGDGSGDGSGLGGSGMLAGGKSEPTMLDLFKMPQIKRLPPQQQWLVAAMMQKELAKMDVASQRKITDDVS